MRLGPSFSDKYLMVKTAARHNNVKCKTGLIYLNVAATYRRNMYKNIKSVAFLVIMPYNWQNYHIIPPSGFISFMMAAKSDIYQAKRLKRIIELCCGYAAYAQRFKYIGAV